MKKLISLIGLLLWASIASAQVNPNQYGQIIGNVQGPSGPAVSQRVYFQIPFLQSFGGSIIYPSAFSVLTDQSGNLPTSPPVKLPYGAVVNVSIGGPASEPRQFHVETQPVQDIWTLIAANSDPPQLVSNIQSGNSFCTISNPPLGSIGTATITCNSAAAWPLTNNVSANGFRITNQGAPVNPGDGAVEGSPASFSGILVMTKNGATPAGIQVDTPQFTIPNSVNTVYAAHGTLFGGDNINFPYTAGTFPFDGTATLIIGGNQSWCFYEVHIDANNGSGSVHLDHSYTPGGIACNTIPTVNQVSLSYASGQLTFNNQSSDNSDVWSLSLHSNAF